MPGRLKGAWPSSDPPLASAPEGAFTIPAMPAPACAWLSGREGNAFDIASCGTGPTLIVSPSVDGGGIERFNLETGNWSSISFLDGACSFLR